MRVLVTGGAGFIGSHLVDAVIEPVIPGQLGQDRALQGRRAVGAGILGRATTDRIDRGFADMLRCVEIRSADIQVNYFFSRLFPASDLLKHFPDPQKGIASIRSATFII